MENRYWELQMKFYSHLAKLVSETTIWTWFSAESSMWLQNLDAGAFVSNFLAQKAGKECSGELTDENTNNASF